MIEATTSCFSKDGKTYLKILGVTTKYVTQLELEDYNRYAVNHNVVYRHQHPSSIVPGEIYGTIIKSDIVDVIDDKDNKTYQGQEVVVEMLEYTPKQQKVVEYAKLMQENGTPIGMSIAKQAYGPKDGPPVAARAFEWSLTNIPFCEECEAVDITMEKEEREARILELEKALNESVELNKAMEAQVGKFEADAEKVKVEAEAKTQSFEEEMRSELKKLNSAYEVKFEDATKELKVELQAVQEQLEQAKREPILAEIAKYEEDAWQIEHVYNVMTTDKLEERLAWLVANKTVPVHPRTARMEGRRGGTSIDAKKAKFLEAMNKKMEEISPLLAKSLKGESLSDAERMPFHKNT